MEIAEKTGHGTVKIIFSYGEASDIQVIIPFNKNVMKNRGTLKNDNLTNKELTLLGIILSNPSISVFHPVADVS